MAKFQGILEFIKNFFNPPVFENRKRRAVDFIDSPLGPKCRRLQSRDFVDLDTENYFRSPRPFRRSVFRGTGKMETIVLDEDDDDFRTKKFNGTGIQNNSRGTKYTSTPHNNSSQKITLNGYDEDDDVKFVKEIKSPEEKRIEAARRGLNYIRTPSIRPIGRQLKEIPSGNSILNGSNKKVNESVRLEDKMNYKKLLEIANEPSFYSTPMGKFFKLNTPTRTDRIMSAAVKKSPTNSVKGRMSTKDTIKKVLGDFENEPVVIKDSDSDSDVIFVNTPEPKPDFKVERVNSLKKVVDTSHEAKIEWLDAMVERHKREQAERQKVINILTECSEKHGKINRDMRMELLTDKVNKSLKIKEAVIPLREEEEELELPELSEAQLRSINRAFKGDPNEVLSSKFNLNITRRDIATLAGLNWLNDEVINFYMNMIMDRGSKNPSRPKTFAFNTFFYPKLMKDGPQSLRRWTKRVDLFEKDLICIPIHLGMHWCMAIIDFRDKSIRYYDSMGSSNNKCLDALRKYLEAEHLDKKKSKYDTSEFELENVKDIPQQMNGSDCGMFSCTFAEFVTRNAKITFEQEHMPYLRKKMVVEILAGELLIQ